MTQIDEALSKLRAGASADALESHRLEFKHEDPHLKRTFEILADAVVCLANADGGETSSESPTCPVRTVRSRASVQALRQTWSSEASSTGRDHHYPSQWRNESRMACVCS